MARTKTKAVKKMRNIRCKKCGKGVHPFGIVTHQKWCKGKAK